MRNKKLCKEYLEFAAKADISEAPVRKPTISVLAKLAVGVKPDEEKLRDDLATINNGRDCSDFTLTTLLRLVYLYGDSELLGDTIKSEIKDTLLDYDYWMLDKQEFEIPGKADLLD